MRGHGGGARKKRLEGCWGILWRNIIESQGQSLRNQARRTWNVWDKVRIKGKGFKMKRNYVKIRKVGMQGGHEKAAEKHKKCKSKKEKLQRGGR